MPKLIHYTEINTSIVVRFQDLNKTFFSVRHPIHFSSVISISQPPNYNTYTNS